MTGCKILKVADWKVGRQTLIKWPKLEDAPYCDETLIKEVIQNSNWIKKKEKGARSVLVLGDRVGEVLIKSSELKRTAAGGRRRW